MYSLLRKETLIITMLFFIYFITRLTNLTLLPIFNDESTYLFLAKTIAATNHQWFASLIWGKGPLFIWIIAGLLKLFPPSMYLLAGRLSSVIFGSITLLGIYKLSVLLFKNKSMGAMSCFLYIFLPFSLFYDRLTLFDSCITAIVVLYSYIFLVFIKTLQLRYSFLLGILIFFALFIKFNAIIPFLISPLVFFLFLKKATLRRQWKTLMFCIVILIICGFFSQLFLMQSSGYPYYMAQLVKYTNHAKNSFAPSLSLSQFVSNIKTLGSWIFAYVTPLTCLLSIFGFYAVFKKSLSQGFFLLLFAFTPIIITALIAVELAARYILYTIPFFLIPLSFLLYITYKKSKMIGIFLIILLFPPLLHFDFFLLFNPPLAPLPHGEKEQFITNPPSGYGLPEVFSFLEKKQKIGPITIVTLGTTSSYPYAFNLQFWENKNVKILPIWPVTSKTANTIVSLEKYGKVYVVLKVLSDPPGHINFLNELQLHQVFIVQKPGGTFPIRIAQP